jgi:hypothetical protein
MSEETTTEATTEVETTEEPQGDAASTDWKAEARKWENRAKAAKADGEDAAKWREYETSQKTEHDKMADQLESAKAEASEASVKLLRYQVASQKGIPANAIGLLTGSNTEELEAAADTLLTLIASQSTKTIMPDFNSGRPASSGSSTADQFAAALNDII